MRASATPRQRNARSLAVDVEDDGIKVEILSLHQVEDLVEEYHSQRFKREKTQ